MTDDRIQRPMRASQPPVRSAPSAAPGHPSGNDPLAELARLIGQNDPFAEYGRENARRAAPPQPAIPAHQPPAYVDDRYAAASAFDAQHQDYAPEQQHGNYPQQFGAPPAFQARGQGYPPGEPGYDDGSEYPTNAHVDAEDHDFYDDVPPRRRMGILAIAAVFALAVVGTAGAFGYRAIFGSSGSSGPPPVIKADASPTKIVPAADSKDPKSGKLIYDRVAERGQNEKLVSREEQPVDRPTDAATPQGQTGAQMGALQAPIGSGVVATEPKKVHTIAIRPDGTVMADATPMAAVATAPPPAPVTAAAPARAPAAEPAVGQAVARAESPPPPHRVSVTAPGNAPLSLSPDAPDQPAPRVTRTAVAAPPTQIAPAQAAASATPVPAAVPAAVAPAGGGSGYAVQVSSQRSEGEAQAAFRSLQAKFPGQLGGKQPVIRQVDLGAKGTYYRAMIGPLGSEQASQLCSSLKAAGGQCIVQRI